MADRRAEMDAEGCIAATFIVDVEGCLWIADRRSEHVACARAKPVLAAGEIFFAPGKKGLPVLVRVSNQSTGYCPEPFSWPAVAAALGKAGFSAPGGYEPALEFRRCSGCQTLVIRKYEDEDCAVCGAALPMEWNLLAGAADPSGKA